MQNEFKDDFKTAHDSYWCWECRRRITHDEYETRVKGRGTRYKEYHLGTCNLNGCTGTLVHLDDQIAPYIFKLNDLGYVTGHCCEGHSMEPFSKKWASMHVLFNHIYPEMQTALGRVQKRLEAEYGKDSIDSKLRLKISLLTKRTNVESTDYSTPKMRERVWKQFNMLMEELENNA